MVEKPSEASSCARNITRTVRCQLDFIVRASGTARATRAECPEVRQRRPWYSHRDTVPRPRSALLAGLPDDDILALAAAAQRRAFAAGEHVFLAGDASRGLLVSAAGRVRIYVLSPATGREVVLTVDGQFGAVAELVALEGAS